MVLHGVPGDEETLGDRSGVEACEHRRNDVTLAPSERIRTRQEIERLLRRGVAQVTAIWPSSSCYRAAPPRSSPIAHRARARVHELRLRSSVIALASPPDTPSPATCPKRQTCQLPAGFDPSASGSGGAALAEVGPEHDHARRAWFDDVSVVPGGEATSQHCAEAAADGGEQFEVVAVESAIASSRYALDPAPAPERVTARSSGGVADPDRSQDLLPARRAREISTGLGARGCPQRRARRATSCFAAKSSARVLELERPAKLRARSRVRRSRSAGEACSDRRTASTSDRSRSPDGARRSPRAGSTHSRKSTRLAARFARDSVLLSRSLCHRANDTAVTAPDPNLLGLWSPPGPL